jgi:hypothetical protein
MLGPNPTQERFRLAAYYLTDLAFQASGDGPLDWGEFMERYSTMYPQGQPGLPDDPVTAYVDSLRGTSIDPGSATTRRAPAARHHDPTRECNVCVAPASSNSESEHAARHRGVDAQWWARLDELAEASVDAKSALNANHTASRTKLASHAQRANDVPVNFS